MKNNNVAMYLIYTMAGLLILVIGAILAKSTRSVQGVMQTLPYLLIGIGAGIFGQNLGTTINIQAMKKAPLAAKLQEIEERDERNIAIKNKAKAKAYDLMLMVFGALMMAFGLMKVELRVVLVFVIAYLFVAFSNVYFISKYKKEM